MQLRTCQLVLDLCCVLARKTSRGLGLQGDKDEDQDEDEGGGGVDKTKSVVSVWGIWQCGVCSVECGMC